MRARVLGSHRMINSALEPGPGTHLGGYEILRPLGRGGMATVFEARREDGQRFALKLLNPTQDPAETEGRFQREFRTLARLEHPNICRFEDRGSWNGRPFFVMELLRGRDLKAEVETWEGIGPTERGERARQILLQITRALEYVHRRGLVHRDVTPGNILVAPDGVAKLTDFGVAKEHGAAELTAHGELLGTIAYVAPEQISGREVDARADLYGLGAVLYLMLTGRRPFQARTLAGFIDKHLHRPPRPPHEIVPGIPGLLEDVCMRLLQKDPARRFASATHLLQVLEGGGHASLDPREWPGLLVGRDEELARIQRDLAAAVDGEGGVIWIEGGAGLGKSRLLGAAAEAAAQVGMVTALARADGGTLSPFVGLAPMLREGGPLPLVVERLLGFAPGEVDRLGAASALRDCFVQRAPILVAIDDMHLADRRSIELCEYLIRTTLSLQKAKIVWAFASTPGVQDGALEGISASAVTGVAPTLLPLRPLPSQEVEQLLLTLLPDTPTTRALARRIQEDAEGNPAFIGEILRALVERGIIRVDEAGSGHLELLPEEVERLPLPIPHSVREALTRRLRNVSPQGRKIADLLAVARRELSLGLIADIAATGGDELVAALDELIDAGVVRERHVGTEELFDLSHLRLRELLYQELAPRSRAGLHRRVGEALERAGRRQLHLVVDSLAWHFEQGEVPGKAYPYLIRAGQRLLDRSFAREAEAFFERAIAIEPDAREHITLDEADRLLADVLLKRAEALDYLGRHAEIEPLLQRARGLAQALGDDRLLGRCASGMAAQRRRAGDLVAAEALHRESLDLAVRSGDNHRRAAELYALGTLRWGKGDVEGAKQLWVESLAIGESVRDDRAIAYGYAGLGFVNLSRGQTADARRQFEQALEVFDRVGLVNAAVITRCNLVELHHFAGNLRRGRELADKALVQAREAESAIAMVHAQRNLALILADLGHPNQAWAEAEAALSGVRKLGLPIELLATLRVVIRSAWALGDRKPLAGLLDEALDLAEKHDQEGSGGVLHAWMARLCAERGDVAGAMAAIRRATQAPASPWPYQECRTELVLSRAYARIGDPAEATRRAEAAIRRADAAGFRLYALKGHVLAARYGADEAAVARHKRVAQALARSLAANLPTADAERFLSTDGVAL